MKEIPTEHFFGKVATKAVIVDGEKILIVLNNGDSDWDLPGGRIHIGETPEVALARECLEEIGASIIVGRPIHAEHFMHFKDNLPHLVLSFEATLEKPAAPFAIPSDEIRDARWITEREIEDEKLFPIIRSILEHYFASKKSP